MLDTLLSWLKEIWKDLWPLIVINQYDGAVLLRNGVGKRVLAPGLHWKIPFVDQVIITIIVPTTEDLSTQTVVTKDGQIITVKGMIKSKVTDVWKFSLEVYDQKDALNDTTMGIIARIIMDRTWAEIKTEEINNEITKKARVAAKQYGIEVLQVTLIDITPVRAYRLYNDHPDHH